MSDNENGNEKLYFHEDPNVEDQNSLEFVQKLANELKGNEKESSFTEDQLNIQVVENFSGCSMTLRQVLGLRARLFQMYMSNQIPAGASNQINQVVVSDAVQMRPVKELSYDSLKRLQQEYELANAHAPVKMDQFRLIPSDLHDQLQVRFAIEAEPNGDQWLEDCDSSWKKWSADVFFERIYKIYPSAEAGTEGTLQHKLQNLTFVLFEEKSFKSVDDLFASHIHGEQAVWQSS